MAIVPIKGSNYPPKERSIFSSSDDHVMMKQIQATHSPDGREFAVRPLLNVVDDIFNRAKPNFTGIAPNQAPPSEHLDAFNDKLVQNGYHEMSQQLAYTINKISCEISCKCSGSGDTHATTLSIFNQLSSYSWDAKVVLALAAFAVNYGEFWLVGGQFQTNPLAKGVALLKQLPDMLEHGGALKSRFDAVSNLIKAMLDVANCIIEFKELPSHYITPDTPELQTATAHIPTAVYWTIRSIVACASQIFGLIGMGHELTASEPWELSSLAHKVNSIHGHLMKLHTLCNQLIEDKKYMEAYQNLIRLFETIHVDNMKILKALIYAKDDQLPLCAYDGSTMKRYSLEVLRKKNVLLLISDLELSLEELYQLGKLYDEAKKHPERIESQYEVVWFPVMDKTTPWNEATQKKFEDILKSMPWYSVYPPTLIDPAVIKYIKEVWNFNQKPLIVVLDPQGKVANTNAIHMMYIWGGLSFPFTSAKEEQLWEKETWNLTLLADNIDSRLQNWITDKKFICLYGGENTEWIRKFTKAAKRVAEEAQIVLEMLYVGKSNPREKVRKNNEMIKAENLGHILENLTVIWFFWVRLASMWPSKVKHNKTEENDPILQEILTILSYDGSDAGWAVFSKGNADIIKAKEDTIQPCLDEFDKWKDQAGEVGFMDALNQRLRELHSPHHCSRLILPGATAGIPEKVVCAECGRQMDKFIMYRCCTD